ncbi:FAD binding domain-containing protein [Biscogniauxia mediterranea]|nr:FAD binding domain-containing protein [Biscogniauxia mediterranea]
MFQKWIPPAAAATLLIRLVAASTGPTSNSSFVSTNTGFGPRDGNSGILPCEALKDAGLGDRLLFPTDPGYEPQILTWYAENSRVRPYCLVLPQSTAEVSTALTALVNANDGAGDWHIAVRSGGHSTIGSNNIENGVTIDLSYMNSSSYDETTNLAKIQPGGRWRNVYADLQKSGVTVAGGRDGDVGVGGFLLGGGNSFYTGRMGFGCDTVVNFEVVLGNGTIVNANSTSNADLWQALKGGSSNFGIVTRFDMEAIPSRNLYYNERILDFNYSGPVLDAVVGYADADQSLADNALVTFFIYNGSDTANIRVGTIYVNTHGNGNVTTPFDKVKDLPVLLNTAAVESMADAALGSQVAGGARSAGSTLTFRNDLQMAHSCLDAFVSYVDILKQSIGAENFITAMFLQPIPSYVGAIGPQKGGNMLGLDEIKDNALLWTTSSSGNTAETHAVAQAGLNAMTAQLKEISKSTATDLDFLYLNYADANQDILGSYGLKNIQHMRDVAARYDPAGVFQKRIPGGFKISRVA